MAVTADQVEVVLKADVAGYLSDLKRAESGFGIIMAKMEKEATSAGRSISRALSGGGTAQFSNDPALLYRSMGLEAANAAREIQKIPAAASAATPTVSRMFSEGSRLAREMQAQARLAGREIQQVGVVAGQSAGQFTGNVGNIAAQFQDIGVTAAMGMNPLIIALQQGTQLSAVMNQSMQAGVSPARALGAAFTQILNPISLGTIALVALTAAAAQYFGSLISDGKLSNEELKAQDDAIRSVADRWGEAVPALQAYVAELDRAKEAGEVQTATEGFIAAQFKAADSAINDLMTRLPGLAQSLRDAGAADQDIQELVSSFTSLDEKIEKGTATTEDANRASQAMAAFVGGPGAHAVSVFGASFAGLAGLVTAAAAAIRDFNAQSSAVLGGGGSDSGDAYRDALSAQFQFAQEQERINGLTAEQLSLENEVARVKAQYARENKDMVLGDKEALTIAQQRLAAEERRREVAAGEKAGAKASTATADEAKAVLELIAALEYEQSLLGMTNEEKAVSNALREAGAAATDQQRARIEELIMATMQEAEAIKSAEAAMKQFQNMATQAVSGFISDLRAGKSAAEALSNVFDNLADQLIQIAVKNLVAAAFSGGGGGFGNIFGTLFGGGKAKGGPVNGGTTYLVGERGPELFTPSSAGNITPNHKMGGMGGGEVTVVVQSGEYFDAHVARVSGPIAAKTVSSGIASYDNNLSSRMVEQDARNR